MIDRSRIGVISLFLLLTQITATGCKQSSENLPSSELFVGVIAVEKATAAEPTYSVLAGTSHLPGLDTAVEYPDTRFYLAHGRVFLSGEDKFGVSHANQYQPLLPAGAAAKHFAFTLDPDKEAPDYFLLLSLYSADIVNNGLDAFTFNFTRDNDVEHSVTFNPPPRALLTMPQEGSTHDFDDDFMLGWTVDGAGYKIELKFEILENGVPVFPYSLWVPVERGQISFSEVKQHFADHYESSVYFSPFGTVRVSVASYDDTKVLDSGLRMVATEVWRQPSSVVITINQ